jgi:hypothetical protein
LSEIELGHSNCTAAGIEGSGSNPLRCPAPHPPLRQCINRWLSVRLELLGISIVFGTAVAVAVAAPRSAGLAGLALTSALNLTGLMNWMVRLHPAYVTCSTMTYRLVAFRLPDALRRLLQGMFSRACLACQQAVSEPSQPCPPATAAGAADDRAGGEHEQRGAHD